MRRRNNKEKQKEYDRAYRMTARGILKTREKKRRYYARLKQDPARWARFQAYHRQYNKVWEARYRRIWRWSLKRTLVRVPAPLPRVEEIPDWSMPDES